MRPEISIVVPVYKNPATLARLHECLVAVLSGLARDFEIVFVDDACPFGSGKVLAELAQSDERVNVITHATNSGQNRAVMTGLAAARGKVAVVMDGDLQDPPEALPLLLTALRGPAAAVFAGRRGAYESPVRLITSWIFKGLLHLASMGRIPPDAGLFVAMKRQIIDRILEYDEPKPYVIGLMGRTGLPLISIPVERQRNPVGTTAYTGGMRMKLAARAVAATIGPLDHPLRGPLLLVLGLYVALASGINLADEGWFLQVVNRLVAGDVLYRDVYFGSTPFSAYVTATLAGVFGVEALLLKTLVVVCCALAVLLVCRAARVLGQTPVCPPPVLLAVAAYLPWPGAAAAGPLANLFFLFSFSAALHWLECHRLEEYTGTRWPRGMLVMAGAASGLCFATRQDIGFYALGAIVVTVFAIRTRGHAGLRRLLSDQAIILGAFALVSALVWLPVRLNGGDANLITYGFTSQAQNIRFDNLPYVEGLRQLRALVQGPLTLENLILIQEYGLYVLAPFTLAGLVLALRRGQPGRATTTTVAVYTTASFLGAVTGREDNALALAWPGILVGVVYLWYRARPPRRVRRGGKSLAPRWLRLAEAGLMLWLAARPAYLVISPLFHLASGEYRASTLPHFWGVMQPAAELERLNGEAQALAGTAVDGPTFLLFPTAGFYYLVSGVPNVTPYDDPNIPAFESYGQLEVIDAISSGRVGSVCANDPPASGFASAQLRQYVNDHMQPGADFGLCTLYR